MATVSIDDYWQSLVDYGIATDDELILVTSIDGHRVDVLDSVLFVRTGYRNWDQFTEAEGD